MQAGRRIGRRRLLRTLAASSGVVAASALVPGKWSKPLVEVGLLPAHAQVTPAPTMTSTPTATPTGTQTPTTTPTTTPTPTATPIRCQTPQTPTQISPLDNATFPFKEAYFDITFTWSTVTVPPGCAGVAYGIEIQFQNPLTSQWGPKFEDDDLGSPTRTFQFITDGSYRWRVWATTAAGDSPRSGWWNFKIGQAI